MSCVFMHGGCHVQQQLAKVLLHTLKHQGFTEEMLKGFSSDNWFQLQSCRLRIQSQAIYHAVTPQANADGPDLPSHMMYVISYIVL